MDRIEELATRILKGDILLPKFQRDFVWERSKIIDLLDSIAKNYPVGSILLWRSHEMLRSERNIADLEIEETQQGYPVNYLLDGQQRLSTVCGALYWSGPDPKSRWNIAYDLRSQMFIHLDTLDDPPLHQIRLNKFPNPSDYFQHVSSLDTLAASDAAELKARAKDLFDRFKDYKIAAVTLHEMNLQSVAPIFERINSRGTALTIVDLMRAATWSGEFDLIDAITGIQDALEAKNFGGIDRKSILRNISACAGGGFSESSIDGLRKHSAVELTSAAEGTRSGYERAVDFLSTEVRIPNDKQVPYANQIVVLAELFRLLPTPTATQFAEISRWFWRTAVGGYFSGWNTGNMADDLETVRAFASGTTKTLPVRVPNPGTSVWLNQAFRINTAHAKILAMLLAKNHPLTLLMEQRLTLTGRYTKGTAASSTTSSRALGLKAGGSLSAASTCSPTS